MPKFEVHIPATEPGGFNMTLKVGADNWMAALKAGMQKLGEQGTVSQNVMVDIQDDNSIHVTEAHSGRVFRIRELSEEELQKVQVKRPSQIRPPPVASSPSRSEVKTDPALQAVPPAAAKIDTTKTMPMAPTAELGKTLIEARGPEKQTQPGGAPLNFTPPTAPMPRPVGSKSSPRIAVSDVEELVQPVKPVSGSIGRPKTNPSISKVQRQSAEDMLADIFLRVVELDRKASVEEAMQWILDLAMEKVPCESGSVLRADGATGELSFIAARGPKAKDVLSKNIVIPAGSGIAGFCSAEGVSVAVSDVEKDPRFYSGVGEKVDYETKSLLCAPMMTHGMSFGCMQLLNRRGGPQFQEHEVGVLAYLAHQAALFLNARLME